jgi:hypothetical protein
MKNMQSGRKYGHDVALIGHKIYVVGGVNDVYTVIRKCERFDVNKGEWERLPGCDFDAFGLGVTLMPVRERYVVAVGGVNVGGKFPESDRLARLDCRKLR